MTLLVCVVHVVNDNRSERERQQDWRQIKHFRTPVEKGLEIIKALRGWTSGLAVPHFVIDAPGGGGKAPMLPEYVQEITDDAVVMRNYAGEEYRYPLPREPVLSSIL